MVRSFLTGVGLGWGAGISPGPLMMLVASSALKEGTIAGLKASLAPVFTDGPVLLIALATTTRLPSSVQTGMLAVGAAYLFVLGVGELRGLRTAGDRLLSSGGGSYSGFWKAVAVNWTSPHVWMFWFTVGAPKVAGAPSGAQAGAFLIGFYLLLIGVKMTIAWIIGSRAHRLSDRAYRRMVMIGGFGLIGFGVFLALEAMAII